MATAISATVMLGQCWIEYGGRVEQQVAQYAAAHTREHSQRRDAEHVEPLSDSDHRA